MTADELERIYREATPEDCCEWPLNHDALAAVARHAVADYRARLETVPLQRLALCATMFEAPWAYCTASMRGEARRVAAVVRDVLLGAVGAP